MVMVLLLCQTKKIQSNDNALVSSAEMIPDDASSNSLESLAKKLNLVIPVSVKKCRKEGERLSERAKQDAIKHSLIILQATFLSGKTNRG